MCVFCVLKGRGEKGQKWDAQRVESFESVTQTHKHTSITVVFVRTKDHYIQLRRRTTLAKQMHDVMPHSRQHRPLHHHQMHTLHLPYEPCGLCHVTLAREGSYMRAACKQCCLFYLLECCCSQPLLAACTDSQVLLSMWGHDSESSPEKHLINHILPISINPVSVYQTSSFWLRRLVLIGQCRLNRIDLTIHPVHNAYLMPLLWYAVNYL